MGADRRSGTLELELSAPASFDVVRLEEAIERGQTIERYRLLAAAGGEWKELSTGTTIGHTKLDRVSRLTANRLKLEVFGFDTPSVAALKLFSS